MRKTFTRSRKIPIREAGVSEPGQKGATGCCSRSKEPDSRSGVVELREFKSHPPH